MPWLIGVLVSNRMASLVELDRDLGLRDAYDLLEILSVDALNRKAPDGDRN